MNATLTAGLKFAPLTRPAPAPVRLAPETSKAPRPTTAAATAAATWAAPPAQAGNPASSVARWATVSAVALRQHYVTVLGWAFTLFNSVRVAAYLPTVWAIYQSGDSSQHSLWTWCTWLGANLTMALWLRERNGGRFCRAAAVNLGNASMCSLTLGLIVWFRF